MHYNCLKGDRFMDIKEFENLILSELKTIVESIIKNNLVLNISAKSRAGAEISAFIENEFVKKTKNHKYLYDSISSPKDATKNPWDVKTYFRLKSHIEEIWIDFKALKISSLDSNPDIGTPNKVIQFIKNGNFYLTYIYVYYREKGNKLEFVDHENNYTKIYFLKDINCTFRRNPKNQLQVNMSAPPEYRDRENFIKLLFQKIKESHQRQIGISNKALMKLDAEENKIIAVNKETEKNLSKKI